MRPSHYVHLNESKLPLQLSCHRERNITVTAHCNWGLCECVLFLPTCVCLLGGCQTCVSLLFRTPTVPPFCNFWFPVSQTLIMYNFITIIMCLCVWGGILLNLNDCNSVCLMVGTLICWNTGFSSDCVYVFMEFVCIWPSSPAHLPLPR